MADGSSAPLRHAIVSKFNAMLDPDALDATERRSLARRIRALPGVLQAVFADPEPEGGLRRLSILARSTNGLSLVGQLPQEDRIAKAILAMPGVKKLHARFDAVCNDNSDPCAVAGRIGKLPGVVAVAFARAAEAGRMTVMYDAAKGHCVEKSARTVEGVKETRRHEISVLLRG